MIFIILHKQVALILKQNVFHNSIFKSALRIFAWGLIYYLVAWFSLTNLLTANGVAIAWPPVGIFIAAILLSKPRERPFMAILLMVADILADMHTGISFYNMLAYAGLSTGDAVISSWILLRYVANPFDFSKTRNLLRYLLFSVILCNGFFSIFVGAVTSLVQGAPFLTAFLYSWVADGVGNLMVVPLIVSWASVSGKDFRLLDLKHVLEILLLITLLIVFNILLFPYSNNGLLFSFIINYLSFPFIIWAILRFDMKIVTLVLLLVTSVMLFILMNEIELFTNNIANFVFFQLYIGSITVISILITSVVAERNEAERKLLFNTVEIEEKERSRYSRELHDGMGPLLSAIKMYVQSLTDAQNKERIKLIAEESNHCVQIAIQTMREVAHGLCPSNLINSGYVNAVLEFTDSINNINDLEIDFKYNTKSRFWDIYEIVLYRITTELINNTLKHAKATRIDIVFNFLQDMRKVSLKYSDNGKGFDAAGLENGNKGMGLMNIKQRTKILGGHCVIESSYGKGIHVSIDFPIRETNNPIQSNLIRFL